MAVCPTGRLLAFIASFKAQFVACNGQWSRAAHLASLHDTLYIELCVCVCVCVCVCRSSAGASGWGRRLRLHHCISDHL